MLYEVPKVGDNSLETFYERDPVEVSQEPLDYDCTVGITRSRLWARGTWRRGLAVCMACADTRWCGIYIALATYRPRHLLIYAFGYATSEAELYHL